jgi:hypothetical protein
VTQKNIVELMNGIGLRNSPSRMTSLVGQLFCGIRGFGAIEVLLLLLLSVGLAPKVPVVSCPWGILFKELAGKTITQ